MRVRMREKWKWKWQYLKTGSSPERVNESLGHGRVRVVDYTESNLYARRGAGQPS